jgi:hypothetical protein
MVMLGIGAGLAIPAATASVMGSVPSQHTGIAAATNGAFLQVGGAHGAALGIAARSAFISGMDLGLATGAVVAVAGGVIALATLPRRAGREPTSPEES